MRFEIVSFDQEADHKERSYVEVEDKAAAKRKAMTECKRRGGPVDLAYDDGREWNDRYITTAEPSRFHASGVRFGRLDA